MMEQASAGRASSINERSQDGRHTQQRHITTSKISQLSTLHGTIPLLLPFREQIKINANSQSQEEPRLMIERVLASANLLNWTSVRFIGVPDPIQA